MHVAPANVCCLFAPAYIRMRESSGSVLLQEAEAAEAEQRRSEEQRMQQVMALTKSQKDLPW